MNYPWWYIPGLTAPMLIAIVSIIHVTISHYAVGGGLLLAMENGHAIRKKDQKYRAYWKKHAVFFILLTMILGGITGVGIWWTIGLTSPLATEMLIRTFVFGWAIEWVFFVLEIVAAFAFYYYWDTMGKRSHVLIGWIYGLAAWISLVLITGITAFMLNSRGLVNDWIQTGNFWDAFLNRQFIPQTVMRTGCALIFATFYVYLHATITEKDDDNRTKIVRRMRFPSVLGILCLILGVVGWFIYLPDSSRSMLFSMAALNIFSGLFIAVCCGMVLLMIIGPFWAPRKMSVGLSAALFLFGVAGIATGEFIREAVRKPFIVDSYIYGNQVYADDVPQIQKNGYLNSGIWTRLYLEKLQESYPELKIAPPRPVVRQEAPTESPKDADSPTNAENMLNTAPSLKSQVIPTQAVIKGNTPSPISNNLSNVGSSEPATIPAQAFRPMATDTPTVPQPMEVINTPEARPIETIPPAGSLTHEVTLNVQNNPEVNFVSQAIGSVQNAVPFPNDDLLKVSEEDQIQLGKVIFMHHCNDCHATQLGYSAAAPLLTGKSKDEIGHFVRNLNRPGFFMPPWCGNDVEAELLANYLVSIRPEIPANVIIDPDRKAKLAAEKAAAKDKKAKKDSEQTVNPEGQPVSAAPENTEGNGTEDDINSLIP